MPPELIADTSLTFPHVLMVRGDKDDWYDPAKLANDESALAGRSTSVQAVTVDARHEWTPGISAIIAGFLKKLPRDST